MRVLLKSGDRHITIYRLILTSNAAIGWSSDNADFVRYVPHGIDHDIHFMYPADGNYHYSYKYVDPGENLKIEKRVYYDKIVTKRFSYPDSVFISVETEDRDLESHNILHMFLPHYKPKSFIESPFFFPFTLVGLSLNSDYVNALIANNKLLTKPKENDIIINLEKYPNNEINIMAYIYDKVDTSSRAIKLEEAITTFKTESKGQIIAELAVLIFTPKPID